MGWRKTRRRTETEEEAEDRGRDSANCDKFEESSPIYPNRDKAFLDAALGVEGSYVHLLYGQNLIVMKKKNEQKTNEEEIFSKQ